jgi:intein/homing endonuclease
MFQQDFRPGKFLLTHATIIASVDTYAPEGMKLGSVLEDGFRVNRKFANFRVTPETQKYINNNCFVPGTDVTMADGTVKAIEDIQVGDLVLTHKGRARRVIETFRHEVDGELLEVTVRGSNERLYVTPEHPFFAFQANSKCVACDRNISRKHRTVSHLIGKHYCSKECYYQHRVPNASLLQEKQGEFIEARDLTTNDFSSTPVVDGEKDVGLTLGQARLLGLFAAEGYYELNSRNDNERVGVCWAFHEDERHTLAKTVVDLMQAEFGVECVIRPHANDRGIHVTTKTNREAVIFFSTHILGDGAKTKHLHGDILTAPLGVQAEILRGWFEGDGSAFDTGENQESIGDFRLTATSASQDLANQMRILLHRQGIAPRMFHHIGKGRKRLIIEGAPRIVSDASKECHSWTLSCGATYITDLVQDTVYEDAYQKVSDIRGGFQQIPDLRFLNGYCLQMFTGLSSVEYRGFVYNFETEEDHSYIVAGVAVHNCDCWSRPVLLASYPTFVGAHNFIEHVQIEDLSKGRIIDAVARDVGDSVYVDILIATDRQHEDLITAIESGKMATLSMGCFVPGTRVTMADGCRIAIEDVQGCWAGITPFVYGEPPLLCSASGRGVCL